VVRYEVFVARLIRHQPRLESATGGVPHTKRHATETVSRSRGPSASLGISAAGWYAR